MKTHPCRGLRGSSSLRTVTGLACSPPGRQALHLDPAEARVTTRDSLPILEAGHSKYKVPVPTCARSLPSCWLCALPLFWEEISSSMNAWGMKASGGNSVQCSWANGESSTSCLSSTHPQPICKCVTVKGYSLPPQTQALGSFS